MKEYLLVWEFYSKDWSLLGKGNHILSVGHDEMFEDSLAEYCERMASIRKSSRQYFIISNCILI